MQSTKSFSTIQESSIAKYLGWDIVPASGARSFHPGDIQSETWLGECKTHTTETSSILFDIKVWKKLAIEAMSLGKRPVLFVDNGTQRIDSTWVMFERVLAPNSLKGYSILYDVVDTGRKNIKYNFNNLNKLKLNHIMSTNWKGVGEVLVLRLSTFKELCEG